MKSIIDKLFEQKSNRLLVKSLVDSHLEANPDVTLSSIFGDFVQKLDPLKILNDHIVNSLLELPQDSVQENSPQITSKSQKDFSEQEETLPQKEVESKGIQAQVEEIVVSIIVLIKI